MIFQPSTVPAQFRQMAESRGKKLALRHKKLGVWKEISWEAYYQQARIIGQALLANGLNKGDHVAILGENTPEWVIIDMGIQLAGGITVGIYTTSSWQQVAFITNHASCKFLFAENEEQVDKYLMFRQQPNSLQKVVFWEEKGLRAVSDNQIIHLDTWRKQGREAEAQNPHLLDQATAAIHPDDVSILVYTSGTTGPPKGAMLTHHNLTWMGHTLPLIDPSMQLNARDEILSYLPLCHIFERLFTIYAANQLGYTVNFVESPDTVPQNLREISPTTGYAVPRIWEKFYSTITIRMKDAKPLKRLVYWLAYQAGDAYARYSLAHRPVPWGYRIGYWLANITVFYHLRKRLGMERMRLAFSGAAPISPDVLRFFHAIGLRLVEGYGLTECSGVATSSPVSAFRLGSVGRPIPGAEVKLADDGEILVRSPGVFAGYYQDEPATQAALQEGWLHTGDIGRLDPDGYLSIIDRKKDLIITAGGKNIAPQHIENKLKFSPYIADAVVIGDRRQFLSALIVLDEENVNQYAQDHKIQYRTYADLAESPAIVSLIEREIDKVNKQVARVESIRKFTILPKKLYEEDGEVTPTMKVKRRSINNTYMDLIEAMYQ